MNYFNFSGKKLRFSGRSWEFVARLTHLFDIFEVLNNFDMSFQSSNGTLSEYISKLKTYVHKLALWIENA